MDELEAPGRHPVGDFYKKYNLRIILCQDNRLVSNTTKTKEDFIAHYYHKFTFEDLCRIELSGLKSGFMHSNIRAQLIPKYVRYVEEKFGVRV